MAPGGIGRGGELQRTPPRPLHCAGSKKTVLPLGHAMKERKATIPDHLHCFSLTTEWLRHGAIAALLALATGVMFASLMIIEEVSTLWAVLFSLGLFCGMVCSLFTLFSSIHLLMRVGRKALYTLPPGENLRGAKLRGRQFLQANLANTDLRDADLRDACLDGADLQSARLEGTDLRAASLRGANLRDANFRGAQIEGADFAGAVLPNGTQHT